MKLLQTTFFSAIITFIKLSAGFISNKVVAMTLGPGGVAVIGQFANFISVMFTFSNGAINAGIVKYVAEYDEDRRESALLLSTALRISVVCSISLGALLWLCAPIIAHHLLMDEFVDCIRVLGLTISLFSINSFILSVLNGKKEISKYTIVNTVGTMIGLVLTLYLVIEYKLSGALYAMVLSQTLIVFFSLYLVTKCNWFSWEIFKLRFDTEVAKALFRYSLMALVSVVTVPVSQMFLRNYVIDTMGISEAGYWQGMMRISDSYLLIITTSLNTYYLPKLASLKQDSDIGKEILLGYKWILPIVAIGCVSVYLMRTFIVRLLFTEDFLPVRELFSYQLLGDFFKVAAWILAYLMLAKAMTKVYIITEIIFSIIYVLLSVFLSAFFGLKGLTMAFALNYFVYFLMMMVFFRGIWKKGYEN
ncbi:O-antigen translocase [Arcticibacter sp.]|uniref:O-antigen translocase n=1 Tax=Arcticibacter sp. TaxID=1872630 RepID=UPI003890434B